MKKAGRSPKTINNHLNFLHGLFAFAEKRGWASGNVVAEAERPRADGSEPDIRFIDLGGTRGAHADPETGAPFDASKMRKRFKVALKAAGVRSIRFHDLRHTFGTKMAAAGAPLRTIQEWMGHRDYKTTEIYADYAPDPVQGARWAEAAFAEEDEEEDGDATDDENEAS